MTKIKEYINGFLSRSGNYVLLSTLFSRGLSFLGSWIALQLIEEKELGVILFAFSIIQFIIPIGGFGLHQSLIRYGALLKSDSEREELFGYVLKRGIQTSLAIIGVMLAVGYLIPFQFQSTYPYFGILSISVLTFFIFEIVKVQFRLQHRNKEYALAEFWYNVILTALIFGLATYFGGYGYIIALIISPLLSGLFFIKRLNIKIQLKTKPAVTNRAFWKYGFFGGLSSVVTQFLVLVDLILVGYLLDDPVQVTNYRYVSIIPMSLLFLPRVFITTDFVAFTEKISDRKYIHNYIKNYMMFFTPISIVLVIIGFFLGAPILSVFGQQYSQFSEIFFVLMIGISGIYIFRGLFGNLLSSIGKIEYNYYIISVAIVLNLISNYFLIPKFGIYGAALTSAALMWFTGILSWICFLYLYKNMGKS